MASTEREPIMAVWGRAVSRVHSQEPMLVKSGGGQNSLKLKAFCPCFHTKEGPNVQDLSDSSAPCNVTQFF